MSTPADISDETALELALAEIGQVTRGVSAIPATVGKSPLLIADLHRDGRYLGTVTTGPINAGDGLLNHLHTDGQTFTWRHYGQVRKQSHCASGAATRVLRGFLDYLPEPPAHLDAAGVWLATAADTLQRTLTAAGAVYPDDYPAALTFTAALAHTGGTNLLDLDLAAFAAGPHTSLLDPEDAAAIVAAAPLALRGLQHAVSILDASLLDAPGDPTVHLYETFLAAFDAAGRRATGTWYTPQPIVNLMTRLVDDVLRTRLAYPHGLADPAVRVVDPATGAGPYLLAAAHAGARPEDHGIRFIGVERERTPAIVAGAALDAAAPGQGVLVHADTLTDPATHPALAAALAEPVTVVLGNPPWRDKASGDGGWIETGTAAHPGIPLDDFREPGFGRYEYVLHNLATYFWRWAGWAAFEAHPDHDDGVICLITTTGYLTGSGFAGMRRWLREQCDEGWIINLTPEGQRPPPATAVFPRIQQPVAIGLFLRKRGGSDTPARIHYRAVHGLREDKFASLPSIDLDDGQWAEVPTGWTAPLMPEAAPEWTALPRVGELMPWHAVGVQANRTWVYAPDPRTLVQRWNRLVQEPDVETRRALFKESYGAKLDQVKGPLPGRPAATVPMAQETGACPVPEPVAYRSFDTQWVIPDSRVLHSPAADLWAVRSPAQVYVTEQHVHPIKGGPALVATAHIPDMDHFNGRGGRVLPLWRDADATVPNLAPGLLRYLTKRFGADVNAHDVLAYLMAVSAHPGFTKHYAPMIAQDPAIRIPITADPHVWHDAVDLGERILALHAGPPQQVTGDDAPTLLIPIPADPMPDTMSHDPFTRALLVGEGRIGNVSAEVADYAVGRLPVLQKWFSYRRANPPGKKASALDLIRPAVWDPALTDELMQLVHTLTLHIAEHPAQQAMLERVLDGPLIFGADLAEAGVLPAPASAARRHTGEPATLFD